MAKNNLSLGNLYRAISGSNRTSQQVSIGTLAGVGAGSNAAFTSFAIDSVTVTPPTFTYIVESTTENATFTFGSPGAMHAAKVGSVAANYSVTFDTANFTVGSATLGATPSFPITPNPVGTTVYSEASASLSMKYQDGYNTTATGYGTTTTKLLYAVDVYNTINQPDFCLLFGTKVTTASGTQLNVEDLVVGDRIKSWVPAGLPDEDQDPESDQLEWRFHMLEESTGEAQDVVVKDITFNFASGYYELNDGLIKATGTHPLWIYDVEINKYRFKAIEDVLIGDKVVTYTDADGLVEVEVYDIAIINEDIEIVTINVENADVYLANGVVSHNKGTTTQPYIPSAGLRMYLDPSKASSTSGTATADWLDLTGYGTGVRPRGVTNAAGITGANPAYNNGASRKEKYWSLATDAGAGWYKDRTTNINAGSNNFDVSAMTYVTWFRLPTAFTAGDQRATFFQKGTDYGMGLSTNSAGVNYRLYWESAISTPFTFFTSSTLSISTSVWYMASYVVSASTGMILYFDTTAVNGGATTISTFPATNAATLQLGHQGAGYRAYQQGPALFFNRALNSTEITNVYNYFSPTYK
jgi:hypothetical protein